MSMFELEHIEDGDRREVALKLLECGILEA
jgi:hypothetical protein